jgi:hypothetical protein
MKGWLTQVVGVVTRDLEDGEEDPVGIDAQATRL